ncbi:MAG TPA: HEAT repeat domain-containing protein [Gemmataceae bacterium]|jgi:hypothetical protein|nr:HEAT repeat domain-containing protein [Gemmataceae bacterium]
MRIKQCLGSLALVLLVLCVGLLLAPRWRLQLLARLTGAPLYEDRSVAYWAYALRADGPEGRARAAQVLSRIGPDAGEAVPALAEALGDSHNGVARAAAVALGNMGPTARAAVPALRAALASPNDLLSVAAAVALWKIDGRAEDVMPVLTACIADRSSPARENAAGALIALGPKAQAAVPTLIAMLGDAGDKGRWRALAVLAAVGPRARAAVPAVTEMLDDEQPLVRVSAADALWRLSGRPDPAVRVLADALHVPTGQGIVVRLMAAHVLAAMGRQAKAAVPALLRAWEEHDLTMDKALVYGTGNIPSMEFASRARMYEDTRAAIAHALQTIDPEAAARAGLGAASAARQQPAAK